ncbi:hypothetical protein DL93DRAFT_2054315 [Clavulina sp. PMI_390]|nr:hypothetical protein DL93DRAFT_2054315 [Clavulina sp. PMI_390]
MAATVEINDGMFCKEHLIEICEKCQFDGREENDSFYGFDTIDRDALVVPSDLQNKDGVYHCKKHSSATCSNCFGWKKQITKLQKDAKKAGRNQPPSSNLW